MNWARFIPMAMALAGGTAVWLTYKKLTRDIEKENKKTRTLNNI
jgi:hypothetical protein